MVIIESRLFIFVLLIHSCVCISVAKLDDCCVQYKDIQQIRCVTEVGTYATPTHGMVTVHFPAVYPVVLTRNYPFISAVVKNCVCTVQTFSR